MIMLFMAALAASSFGLSCTGTETAGTNTGGFMPHLDSQTSVSKSFQVDLDAKRWCSDDCLGSFPINEVTDYKLTLEKQSDKELGSDSVIVIDRETGKFGAMKRTALVNGEWGAGSKSVLTEGVCTRSAFKGLPQRKF